MATQGAGVRRPRKATAAAPAAEPVAAAPAAATRAPGVSKAAITRGIRASGRSLTGAQRKELRNRIAARIESGSAGGARMAKALGGAVTRQKAFQKARSAENRAGNPFNLIKAGNAKVRATLKPGEKGTHTVNIAGKVSKRTVTDRKTGEKRTVNVGGKKQDRQIQVAVSKSGKSRTQFV